MRYVFYQAPDVRKLSSIMGKDGHHVPYKFPAPARLHRPLEKALEMALRDKKLFKNVEVNKDGLTPRSHSR